MSREVGQTGVTLMRRLRIKVMSQAPYHSRWGLFSSGHAPLSIALFTVSTLHQESQRDRRTDGQKSFRGALSFLTWLCCSSVNQVLMHFRKRSVKDCRADIRGIVVDQTDARAERPMRMSVMHRIALEEAVRRLPPRCRTVFVLHDVEGLADQEIAESLGCSIDASRAQLHEARMRLRVLLG
jgi:RNA polymerase sigma factor (sigma-70 family)